MPRRQPGPRLEQPAPAVARLEPYREKIARRLHSERPKLSRIQELLEPQGVPVKYMTQRQVAQRAGLRKRRRLSNTMGSMMLDATIPASPSPERPGPPALRD